MVSLLPVESFLAGQADAAIIDVRTPDEFGKGHIPAASNVPLFTNEERAQIGTVYKQQGRQPAVSLGLRYVGPRMESMADKLLDLAAGGDKELRIHCWRGGMRSDSVAWLMKSVYGCRVAVLQGGYKAFRRWVLDSFQQPRQTRVLSGLTGTGKTEILRVLKVRGENVLDLEALANHKGSAFGALGESPQPTQTQFENHLAIAWRATDPERPVWVEDESRTIGRRVIPGDLWQQKQAGSFDVVEIPETDRVANLCKVYGTFPAEDLRARVGVIHSRLGHERARQAEEAIQQGDITAACRSILIYYDRTYRKSMRRIPQEKLALHRFEHSDPQLIAQALIEFTS